MDVPLHLQKRRDELQPGDDLSKGIADIGSRLRVLEERYLNLRKKIQVTDQNLIETEKNHMSELRELNNKLTDLMHTLSEINEKITLMLGELQSCVREEEFKVVKKYVELWQPQNFVTQKEVQDIVQESKHL